MSGMILLLAFLVADIGEQVLNVGVQFSVKALMSNAYFFQSQQDLVIRNIGATKFTYSIFPYSLVN